MAEFSTNPGDRSVTELEREVDRERERVSATIDELQSRASVGSLVDQLVKAVGENGGEVSRNLGRSLRDNPLAALLTGVGLAWLMAGSGRPRDEGRDWEDPDREYLRYGRDRLPEASTPSASAYGSSADGSWPNSEYPDRDDCIGRGRPSRARCRRCRPGWRGGLRRCRRHARARLGYVARGGRRAHIGPATPSARPAALSVIAPEPRVGALPGQAVTCAMASTP